MSAGPDDFKTKEPAPEPSAVDGARQVPALVVVWSPHEPSRVGEVLLLAEPGVDFVFGRGDEGAKRAFLQRQRPGQLERMEPIKAEEISREALLINNMPVGLVVRPGVSQRAVKVNGEPIDLYKVVEAGDTVEVDRQIMFLVTKRPAAMPPLRFARIDMPFGEPDRHGMIGESPLAWKLRDDLAWAAQVPGHVFIHGESGAGKELAANAIHRDSARAKTGMCVSQSAAALTSSLLDAELFGNAKNFPNPGMPERAGLIGAADGGTLFLDEIGEMPHELHAHLLRVLDPGAEYRRLGESHVRRSNFRLITATNRDRSALKHDFLARLSVEIELPSFRERREDVPLLARARVLMLANESTAVRQYLRTVDGRLEPQFAVALIDHLVRLPYETNAREIAKLLSSSIAQSARDVLVLPPRVRESSAAAPQPTPTPAAPEVAQPDAAQIREALTAGGGNVSRAARELGVSRQALYRLMAKLGIPN